MRRALLSSFLLLGSTSGIAATTPPYTAEQFAVLTSELMCLSTHPTISEEEALAKMQEKARALGLEKFEISALERAAAHYQKDPSFAKVHQKKMERRVDDCIKQHPR